MDDDSSFAAKFLTKKDLTKAHELLKEVFKEIDKQEPYHLPLYYTITSSRYNFMWFAEFFYEITKITGANKPKINFDLCPKKGEKELEVYQPFLACTRGDKALLYYPKINVKNQSPINNYRIKYIAASYDLEEFQDDQYPGWYLLRDTTVFEQYNEKTNTRVRVDFRNGRFYYMVAGASDNWYIVEDVPQEVDHVVSALLFRNVLS